MTPYTSQVHAEILGRHTAEAASAHEPEMVSKTITKVDRHNFRVTFTYANGASYSYAGERSGGA